MILLFKLAAWPFIVVGFIFGFIFAAVGEGFSAGALCIEQLITHYLEGKTNGK